ncbi:DMT family transporter [Pontibacter silvestris]|uniref:DMT family transporter n=1 Tax=Pontibacter silvestris TaxID=2305183 RepID=A0ABW4WU86_9BACT|nr:multidrug efflux SMR transporter [Pontibacter silvestris]MCC9137741.1 multidrug efflux SMR transporter [Pontibacter silvestris]
MHYVYLLLAIISEVIATSALKASEQFTKLTPSIIVVVGYAIAFYMLSLALRVLPVGIAYALWSGVGIILVSLVGVVFYNQQLDTAALLGMLLIIAGVIIINVFSRSVSH